MTDFRCENCKKTFTEGDEDAALAEWASVPEWRDHPKAIVCDDCWQQIIAWAKAEGLPVPKDD